MELLRTSCSGLIRVMVITIASPVTDSLKNNQTRSLFSNSQAKKSSFEKFVGSEGTAKIEEFAMASLL